MQVLSVILKVIYFLDCVALIGIVLLQKGKTAGLSGAIGGAAETYWGKSKSRSMEGGLHKTTIGLAVGFIVLSLLLNII